MQRDVSAAASVATRSTPTVMVQRLVGPDDSGYLGGWTRNDPAREAGGSRTSATTALAGSQRIVYPEDSGYLGGGV